MSKRKVNKFISDDVIMNKIYFVRGHRVMIDRDLAVMYDTQTKRIKEAVRRNISRFPEHFLFELTKEEFHNWRSQFASSNPSDKMGLRYPPFCFTEHGVLMLSNVLKSNSAVKMSIRIVEIFVKMREMLSSNKDILIKLEQLERKLMKQDERSNKYEQEIKILFEAISQLITHSNEPRKKIGYKRQGEE